MLSSNPHGNTYLSLIITICVVISCLLFCLVFFGVVALVVILKKACSKEDVEAGENSGIISSVNSTSGEKLTLEAAKKKYLDDPLTINNLCKSRRSYDETYSYVSPKKSSLFYVEKQKKEMEKREKIERGEIEDDQGRDILASTAQQMFKNKRMSPKGGRKSKEEEKIFSYGSI